MVEFIVSALSLRSELKFRYTLLKEGVGRPIQEGGVSQDGGSTEKYKYCQEATPEGCGACTEHRGAQVHFAAH